MDLLRQVASKLAGVSARENIVWHETLLQCFFFVLNTHFSCKNIIHMIYFSVWVLTLKKLVLLSNRPLGASLGGEQEAMLSSCSQVWAPSMSGCVFTSGAGALLVKNTLELWCNQRKFLLRPQPALTGGARLLECFHSLSLSLFCRLFLLSPHSPPLLFSFILR